MKYVRCNALGLPCRFMSKGETAQEVINQLSLHLKNVHDTDPQLLIDTIKVAMKTRMEKAVGRETEPPVAH